MVAMTQSRLSQRRQARTARSLRGASTRAQIQEGVKWGGTGASLEFEGGPGGGAAVADDLRAAARPRGEGAVI